jgi:hypothetical protein
MLPLPIPRKIGGAALVDRPVRDITLASWR